MSYEVYDESKFRFWCQKVLPAVYDDSLSYYELLDKVIKTLNSNIVATNEIIEKVQEMSGMFTNPANLNELASMIGVTGSTFQSIYNQDATPMPEYLEIPSEPSQAGSYYTALIGKYDNIHAKNGASLEKITWKDNLNNPLDETGNTFYYYEIMPTLYNKSYMGVYAGNAMNVGEITFKQSFTDNTVIISAGVHGNERQSIESVYALTKFICEDEGNIATYLRNNVHFVIVPCVNPYGYNNNTRLTYGDVDVNRNFPTSTWSGSSDEYKGDAPLSSRSAQFLAGVLSGYVGSTNANGCVYIDSHDFVGGDTYADFNVFSTVSNISLRSVIANVFTKIYNILDAQLPNVKKSERCLRVTNLSSEPTAALYAFENGLYYSAIVENRLRLISETVKYDWYSRFISWTMLSGVIMHAVTELIGKPAPFKNPVKLSDINASTSDTVFSIAKKLDRFGRISFVVLAADIGTNLAQSLPTYDDSGDDPVFYNSMVVIDKSISYGQDAIIWCYKTSGTLAPEIYQAFVQHGGTESSWYQVAYVE